MSAGTPVVVGLGLGADDVGAVHLNRDPRVVPGGTILESIVIYKKIVAVGLDRYLMRIGGVGEDVGIFGFLRRPFDGRLGCGVPVVGIGAYLRGGGGEEIVRVGQFFDEDGCLFPGLHGYVTARRLLKRVNRELLSCCRRDQAGPVDGAVLVALGVSNIPLLSETAGNSGTVQLDLHSNRTTSNSAINGNIGENQILARCIQSDLVTVGGMGEARVLASGGPL